MYQVLCTLLTAKVTGGLITHTGAFFWAFCCCWTVVVVVFVVVVVVITEIKES